jgi:L-ascorbate metabolism protein UlaG (beta-lactamase superfamily)
LLVSKYEAEISYTKRKGAIYHAGDTGYRRTLKSTAVCPIFKEIGQKFGPFNLLFVPIWRGSSLGFISYLGLRLLHDNIPSALHLIPADVISIHNDVLSRNIVAVHFGTFVGSENESLEAIIEFNKRREIQEVLSLNEPVVEGRGRAGILNIGGSIAVEINIREVVHN